MRGQGSRSRTGVTGGQSDSQELECQAWEPADAWTAGGKANMSKNRREVEHRLGEHRLGVATAVELLFKPELYRCCFHLAVMFISCA